MGRGVYYFSNGHDYVLQPNQSKMHSRQKRNESTDTKEANANEPHQHLFSWYAYMIKYQDTIIHSVICTISKFCSDITDGDARKR